MEKTIQTEQSSPSVGPRHSGGRFRVRRGRHALRRFAACEASRPAVKYAENDVEKELLPSDKRKGKDARGFDEVVVMTAAAAKSNFRKVIAAKSNGEDDKKASSLSGRT